MALDFKKLHVLVVEDLAPMRELTIYMLRALGVGKISKARDGDEGFEMFCRQNPDIVLSDWHMLPMNGIDMVRKIRISPNSPCKTTPVIMMTGFSAFERISESRDSGVTEFLVKPFSGQDLAKRIEHVIKKPRDFIVAENFAGPDRRRVRKENFAGSSKRKADTGKKGENGPKQVIKANFVLQSKVGVGAIDPLAIMECQRVIDENKIDFIPLAKMFLDELEDALEKSAAEEETTKRSIERLINPVMQIKANARIFGYSLVGDLAGIMLNFLETLNVIDQDAVKIVQAHHKTLNLLVTRGMSGDCGDIGNSFRSELDSACGRYSQAKTHLLKQRFRKELEKKAKELATTG